jgi:hypothetical protein
VTRSILLGRGTEEQPVRQVLNSSSRVTSVGWGEWHGVRVEGGEGPGVGAGGAAAGGPCWGGFALSFAFGGLHDRSSHVPGPACNSGHLFANPGFIPISLCAALGL